MQRPFPGNGSQKGDIEQIIPHPVQVRSAVNPRGVKVGRTRS